MWSGIKAARGLRPLLATKQDLGRGAAGWPGADNDYGCVVLHHCDISVRQFSCCCV